MSMSPSLSQPPWQPPPRFKKPSLVVWVGGVVLLILLVDAWRRGIHVDPLRLGAGVGNLVDFLQDAWPPDVQRIGAVLVSLLQTFEMAVVGTLVGVAVSVPVGLSAARNTCPHPAVYYMARFVVTVSRTIPDLVWGLLFVIAVGLGPRAGVLALSVDTIGFAGRFFAEAFEEMDDGPVIALKASGCGALGWILGGAIPSTAPSLIASSMFCLEQATRSAVVLGVVGAGGIGVELSVAMTLFRYDEALTIILCIFAVVWSVERVSAGLRRRVITGYRLHAPLTQDPLP